MPKNVSLDYKALFIRHVPNRSLIIPRIPAMLETLFEPNRGPSFNRRSPVGLSITRVGAECADGDVKA